MKSDFALVAPRASTESFRPWELDAVECSLATAFERQVRRVPDHPAVQGRTSTLTFRQLDARANRIAHALLVGGHPGERVALLLAHDTSMIAGLLGTWKAGMVAVPLDATHPGQRLERLVNHVGCRTILTENRRGELATRLGPPGCLIVNLDAIDLRLAESNPGIGLTGGDLAFILFTSGSTGAPKGVMQTHRNSLRGILAYTNATQITSDDRVAVIGSCAGGHSMQTLGFALMNGATVLPFDLREEGIECLAGFLRQEGVTILFAGATVFRHLVRALGPGETLPKIRFVQLSTEPVSANDVAAFRGQFPPECQFFNAYGTTETTNLTLHRIDPESAWRGTAVPVRRPVDGIAFSLLDEQGREAGVGETGEIVVRSRYLSPGYWGDEKLTAEVFRDTNDGSGERVYHTGDLGRRAADGALVHLGRKDFQVKVRGYRIELEEVEAALCAHPAVVAAAVSARPDPSGDNALVAHVVLQRECATKLSELREQLRTRLAPPMLPAHFIRVSALPATPSGKLDRRALALLEGTPLAEPSAAVAPRNATELALVEIWQRVLAREHVGVTDNFFAIGGHSLLAMRLVREIGKHFGRSVPVATVFTTPTIEELARGLTNPAAAGSMPAASRLRGQGPGTPLFHLPAIDGVGLLPAAIAAALESDRPFFDGFQLRGVDGLQRPADRLEEIAAHVIPQIRSVRPSGPYCLAGFSFGGLLAHEVACQLATMGETVQAVVLWDPVLRHQLRRRPLREAARQLRGKLARKSPADVVRYAVTLARGALWSMKQRTRFHEPPEILQREDLAGTNRQMIAAAYRATRAYRPRAYSGRVLFLRAQPGQRPCAPERVAYERIPLEGWGGVLRGPLEVVEFPCDHLKLWEQPTIGEAAKRMAAFLRETDAG